MIKTDQNGPGLLILGGKILMILRKSDEAIALSASVVATAMVLGHFYVYFYVYCQRNNN